MCAYSIGPLNRHCRRCRNLFGYGFASYLMLQTDSPRCGRYFWQAHEIVSRGGEHEEPLDPVAATMAGLAQAADRLDPAEGFLDPLALDRTETIAGMTGRAPIDRRATVGVILRDMQPDPEAPRC